MKNKILDLIDFEKVDILLEGFNKATGFVTAILDLDGNILSKSGWRQICTDFHRVNPETSKKCTISDTVLAGKMGEGEKYHFYKCLNGLVDVAVPIIIDNKHVANLFSGQFFFEKPDLNFFKKQAEKYKFDHKTYLEALDKVPVVSEEKVKTAMDFLLNMTNMISEMTQQKLEQTELNNTIRESEEKFKTVFESANVGKSITSPSGKIDVNPAFCKMLGYTRKELQNKKWQEITPEGEIPTIQKMTDSLLQGKKDSVRFEKRYICKNGTHIWADVSTSIRRNNKGEPLHFITTIIDITKRKLAEELSKKSEEELKKAQEITHIGNWHLDFKTNNVVWSEELYKIYGFDPTLPPPQLDRSNTLFTPESWELLSTSIAKTGETGIPYEIELKLIRKDGSNGWMWASGEAVKDNDGKIVGLWGATQDITEQKQAEEKLRTSEAKFRAVAEVSPIAIYASKGEDQKGIYTNKDFHTILGYSLDEVPTVGEWWLKAFPDEKYRQEIIDQWTYNIEQAEKNNTDVATLECICTCKDGSEKMIAWVGKTIGDEFWAFGYDFTERRQAEELVHQKDIEFRKLSSNMSDLIFQFTRRPDGSYCVPIASDGIKNIFGCSQEDVRDDFTPIANVILPEDVERVFSEIEYSAQHLTNFNSEFRVQIPGKDIQWTYAKSTPEKLADGSITWYGFVANITERKQAEEIIRKKDSEFRKLSANVPDLIFQFTRKPDGTYIVPVASQGIINIFGCTPEDVKDDFGPIGRVIHPDDAVRVINDIEYSANNLTYFTCEFRVQIPGKPVQWIYSKSSPEKLADGSITWYGFNTNITERKQVEEKLKENYDLLRIAGDKTKLGGWNVNLEENRSYWSDQVADIHEMPAGYSPLVEDGINFYAPEWHDKITELFTKCAQEGIPYDAEMEIITSTGKRVWVRTIGEAVKDDKGKIVKVQGAFQEITERKEREKALQLSESNLMALINNTQDSIWSLDRNFNYIIFNKTYADHFYREKGVELVKGMNAKKHLTSEELAFWVPLFDTVLKGEKQSFEFNQAFGSVIHYFHTSLNPIYEDGIISGVSAMSIEITNIKRAEKAIIESEEKFKMSFYSNPVAQAIHTLEGVIVEANPAYSRLIGFSIEEIIGKTSVDLDLFSKEERNKLAAQAKASGGSISNAIAKFKIRDNSVRDILYSVEPIVLNGIPHRLSMGIDITDQKIAEAELTRIKENLEVLVEERTKELEDKYSELERMNKLFVGRELRMVELKEKIKNLENEL